MKNTPVSKLLEKAGSQTLLAKMLGTSQQNISNWNNAGKPLPAEFVLAAEKELGISRHDLRPDIYPREQAA